MWRKSDLYSGDEGKQKRTDTRQRGARYPRPELKPANTPQTPCSSADLDGLTSPAKTTRFNDYFSKRKATVLF